MKKYIIILIFLTLINIPQNSISQIIDCGFDGDPNTNFNVANPFAGLHKPTRSDSSGSNPSPTDAFFPVLVVFVEFPADGGNSHWPDGQAPAYRTSFISTIKRTSSEWWNSYSESNESVSDYWQEVSRSGLHVVSPNDPFYVLLDHDSSWYGTGITADHNINAEIWRKLKEQGLSDWRPYDRWRKGGDGKFYYEQDSIVDFVYKIHKSTGRVLLNFSGYAHLTRDRDDFTQFLVDTANSIKIQYGFDSKGSGLTICRLTRENDIIQTIGHEHAHFLYADGHITYGKVSYGIGLDGNFSPFEMTALGYMIPRNVTFASTESLEDYSSRNTVMVKY